MQYASICIVYVVFSGIFLKINAISSKEFLDHLENHVLERNCLCSDFDNFSTGCTEYDEKSSLIVPELPHITVLKEFSFQQEESFLEKISDKKVKSILVKNFFWHAVKQKADGTAEALHKRYGLSSNFRLSGDVTHWPLYAAAYNIDIALVKKLKEEWDAQWPLPLDSRDTEKLVDPVLILCWDCLKNNGINHPNYHQLSELIRLLP